MARYIVFTPNVVAETLTASRGPDVRTPSRRQARKIFEIQLASFLYQKDPPRLNPGNQRIITAFDRGSMGRTTEILPQLGAAVFSELTPAQIEHYEEAGAVVVMDQEVSLPVTQRSSLSLERDGSTPWHLQSIRLHSARKRNFTGRGVTIGFLDTGIAADHPEFSNKDVLFQSFDRDGNESSSVAQDYGHHGTHVCGVAAGGVNGVACDADIAMAAVLTESNGTGTLVQVAAGFNWLLGLVSATGEGLVSVINASLGSRRYDGFLEAIIDAAALQGVVVIAAIGNSGHRGEGHHGSPGNYSSVTGVGATDEKDVVTEFSDWGRVRGRRSTWIKPDLCAPGERIISASPSGGSLILSGTSMAAPICAGAAALLIQRDPAIREDVTQIHAQLRGLTRPVIVPGHSASRSSARGRGGAGTLDLSGI